MNEIVEKVNGEVSKELGYVEATLNDFGISLRDSNGNIRKFKDVFDEVSSKWAEVDSSKKQAVMAAITGSGEKPLSREDLLKLVQKLCNGVKQAAEEGGWAKIDDWYEADFYASCIAALDNPLIFGLIRRLFK